MTPTLPADLSFDGFPVVNPLLAYDPHVLVAIAAVGIAALIAAILLAANDG